MLTQSQLKELLHYDSDTGIFIWITKPAKRIKIGDVAGYIRHDGYVHMSIDRKLYLAHRLAWLYVYGYFPEYQIDHIDRISHHNWITNLRHVSQSCNMRNTGNPITNTSGIKGVSWHKRNKRWVAKIAINRKSIYLGSYETKLEAARARLKVEQEHNWAGCDSSSPANQYVKRHSKS